MQSQGLEVIVGCELTAGDGTQVIGLEVRDVVRGATALDLMEGIKGQGGRVLLPHPFRYKTGVLRTENRRGASFVDDVLALADLIECFNGRDTYADNRSSYRFAVEHRLAAVASSDAHTAGEIGSVFVEYPGEEDASSDAPRWIHHPGQRPSPDMTLVKRAFHSLPTRVQDLARSVRSGAGMDPTHASASDARPQYVLPPPGPGGDQRG
jgi:predicted metal-dependent phosphoesterase TrpH